MLNKTILMGRLTREPELRYTQSNTPVCSFTLAVERPRKDANGKKTSDFLDVTAWGKSGEFVKQWFTKGMMAIVVGRMQTSQWEDKNGNKRTSVFVNAEEVNFGETKKKQTADITADDFNEIESSDDDVPF